MASALLHLLLRVTMRIALIHPWRHIQRDYLPYERNTESNYFSSFSTNQYQWNAGFSSNHTLIPLIDVWICRSGKELFYYDKSLALHQSIGIWLSSLTKTSWARDCVKKCVFLLFNASWSNPISDGAIVLLLWDALILTQLFRRRLVNEVIHSFFFC